MSEMDEKHQPRWAKAFKDPFGYLVESIPQTAWLVVAILIWLVLEYEGPYHEYLNYPKALIVIILIMFFINRAVSLAEATVILRDLADRVTLLTLQEKLFSKTLTESILKEPTGTILNDLISSSVEHMSKNGFIVANCDRRKHFRVYEDLRNKATVTIGTNIMTPAETMGLLESIDNEDTTPDLKELIEIKQSVGQSSERLYVKALKDHFNQNGKSLFRITALTEKQILNIIRRNLKHLEIVDPAKISNPPEKVWMDLPEIQWYIEEFNQLSYITPPPSSPNDYCPYIPPRLTKKRVHLWTINPNPNADCGLLPSIYDATRITNYAIFDSKVLADYYPVDVLGNRNTGIMFIGCPTKISSISIRKLLASLENLSKSPETESHEFHENGYHRTFAGLVRAFCMSCKWTQSDIAALGNIVQTLNLYAGEAIIEGYDSAIKYLREGTLKPKDEFIKRFYLE